MNIDFKTLEQLKAIFTAEQFVLTGSAVVNILGFKTAKPQDIDILLYKPTPESIEKLKEFQEKFPKKGKTNYEKPNIYQFIYNEVNVDVFITDIKHDEHLTYNNIIISPLNKVVTTKKTYNSPKHMFQLMNWRNQIITDNEINKFITKI